MSVFFDIVQNAYNQGENCQNGQECYAVYCKKKEMPKAFQKIIY